MGETALWSRVRIYWLLASRLLNGLLPFGEGESCIELVVSLSVVLSGV